MNQKTQVELLNAAAISCIGGVIIFFTMPLLAMILGSMGGQDIGFVAMWGFLPMIILATIVGRFIAKNVNGYRLTALGALYGPTVIVLLGVLLPNNPQFRAWQTLLNTAAICTALGTLIGYCVFAALPKSKQTKHFISKPHPGALVVMAMILAILLGVSFGILAAHHRF